MSQAQKTLRKSLPGGYTLHRPLAQGMFAYVYEGRGPDGQRVAIKILRSDHAQAKKRFQREIKVLRALPNNPHVVRYLDHGTTYDGTLFLVMEFVVGFTLGRVLSSGRRFTESAACALMLELCQAFEGLHKLGLAHGDIKPNNIMLGRTPGAKAPMKPVATGGGDVIHLGQVERSGLHIKLLDFGLVRDAQGLLKLMESEHLLVGTDFDEDLDMGMIAGTPEYIAPEQVEDARLQDPALSRTDTSSDVFGLGVIFYNLLSGRSPWPFSPDAKDQATYRAQTREYLNARETDDTPAPRLMNISQQLWSIIRRALDYDPKRRQFTAREFAHDIERYLEYGVGVPSDIDTDETTMAYLSDLTPDDEADESGIADAIPRLTIPAPPDEDVQSDAPEAAPPHRRRFGKDRWVWLAAVAVFYALLVVEFT